MRIEDDAPTAAMPQDSLDFPGSHQTGGSPPLPDKVLAGRYEILQMLGRGGMGTVYQARDRELDRLVALKVIRPELAGDPENLRRFKQEVILAREIAHKNVVRIFDLGVADGTTFISMEYIEGRDLWTLLRERGPRPPGEAVEIIRQVCQGLAAAHAEGVVHRDLKPRNIMLDEHGRVSVMDFGIADSIRTPHDTQSGQSLGTLAYMAPEQARGGAADHRSDLFTVGVIFHQMLTGKTVYRSENLDSAIPPALAAIIAKCLHQNPGVRYQSADEILRDLDAWMKPAAEAPDLPHTTGVKRRGLLIVVSAIVLLLVVSSVFVTRRLSRPAGQSLRPALTKLTGDSGLTAYPAFSPDGKYLAYASDRDGEGNLSIWLQKAEGGEPTRVTHHEADDREPAFSPDGRAIVFHSERSGGGVYVVPAIGGEPRLLAPRGRRPRFSPDGSLVLYWVRDERWAPGKIFVVPAAGGTPRQLQPEFADAHYPIWSPDGKAVLFCGTRQTDGPKPYGHDWWVTPLQGGPAIQTGAFDVFRQYTLTGVYGSLTNSSGDILGIPGDWARDSIVFSARFGDSENLWRLPIEGRNYRITTAPRRLTFGASLEIQPSISGDRVVFMSGEASVAMWALQVEGDQGKVRGEPQPLMHKTTVYNSLPSVSSDESHLAFIRDRSGNREIWIQDLASGRETQLSASSRELGYPRISRNGRRVAYRMIEKPKQAIYVVPAEGGAPEKVCADCGLPTDWSSDGQQILFEPGAEIAFVGLLQLASREKTEIAQHPRYSLRAARFSPGDRWIAFHAETGLDTRRIYVAPFHPGRRIEEADWVPITDGSTVDFIPSWSPDGNLLYFLSERDGFRCIWAQRLQPANKRLVGRPFGVYHFHAARRSLLTNVRANPLQVGLSASRHKLFFSLDEITGNIWMTRLEDRP